MEKIKYNRLKKIIKENDSEEYLIERDIYDKDTGELQDTVENYVDPEVLADREQVLESEAKKVKELRNNISQGRFDKKEDRRSIGGRG